MTLLQRLFPQDVHHVAGLHSALAEAMPLGGRVLDLGCGINIDLARYRTEECQVWGTDFEPHADLNHPQWFRRLGPQGEIPFPADYFDTVASVMVLEHVKHPEQFLREVARVLRTGGRFVGHSISGTHYVTFLRRLFGVLPHSVNQAIVKSLYGRDESDTFPAYYRMNTQRQLTTACNQAGLELLSVRRYADPGYFRFMKPLESLAILADRTLEYAGSGWGRLYFTVVLSKPAIASVE